MGGGSLDDEPALSSVLTVVKGDVISIVGAGGKTTTMYRLCHELVVQGLRVVSTTTTAFQRPTARQSPLLLLAENVSDLASAVQETLAAHRHVSVASRARRADKVEGVDCSVVSVLREIADVVVIEADGARHARIKAPADHEPVVPEFTTIFLTIAGLHALGHPLRDVCHRPDRAASLCHQAEESPVTPDTMSRILGSRNGGLKGRPPHGRAWALLTHLTASNEQDAMEIARSLPARDYDGAVALSLTRLVRLL